MAKKGLGTGLEALLGDAAADNTARDFEYIPLTRIEPKEEQPRTVFEQDALAELTESVREHGVLSPIMVRSIGDNRYEIIAGERRWRAAREAGLSEVPARVVIADDKKALELAMVENLQREDLNPLEEARGYKALMDEFNMTQEEVARSVSKSRPSVANSMRLLALPDELKELMLRPDRNLSAGSARALLALKSEEDMKKAAHMVVENAMSVREVEALVKKFGREKSVSRGEQRGREIDYLLEAEKQLTSLFGRRVKIKPLRGKERGKGKIEFEYYDPDDFDALFDTLSSKGKPER